MSETKRVRGGGEKSRNKRGGDRVIDRESREESERGKAVEV